MLEQELKRQPPPPLPSPVPETRRKALTDVPRLVSGRGDFRTSFIMAASKRMKQLFQKQLFPRIVAWNLRTLHGHHGKVAQRVSREGIFALVTF